MRKILFILLMMLPMVIGAHDFEVDGIYYIITDTIDNEVWVSFRGGSYDYNSNEYSGEVNIPETVTYNDITYSVTGILGKAFYDCQSLTSVNISNSVIEIGAYTFYNCTNLTSVTFGNSVTTIGSFAFYGTELTNFDIPNSVIHIGNRVFEGTPWYRNQPDGLIYVGLVAWQYKGEMPSGTWIRLKDGTLGIGDCAFFNCTGLTKIDIPNSVTLIGGSAFVSCSSLTKIVIPSSVTFIGDYAFVKCRNLRSIEIPTSITHMGFSKYEYCSNISSLLITGEGEWEGGSFSDIPTSPRVFIDSRVSSLREARMPHSDVCCFATIPPACNAYSFKDYSGTLHVPPTSLASYFTADYWSNFANIVGDAIEPNVTISQDSLEVVLGAQCNLTASVMPTDAYITSISWRTTNPTVASVDYNGIVTAVGVGECDIIAECLYKRDTCHVVVNDTIVTIILDQQEAIVLPNHIITLTPSASPIVPDLSVTSSDPSVAAARVANNKVQVVGIKEGTTTITVGSADGTAIPAICLVTVYTEPGDMNCDGFVNISDVTSLIDYLLSGDDSQISTKNADVNGDESINISDVTILIDILLSGN